MYFALVRKYHPKGYASPFFAGCTKREGNMRVTDICAHQHETQEAAQTCADNLTAIRNKEA